MMTDNPTTMPAEDDEWYYEEETIDDEDDNSIESVDENGFPVVRSQGDSVEFIDDDSSAPPDEPPFETGWQDLYVSFDMQVDAAAEQGARKASQEAMAREEHLQRLAAREALQRKCREQENLRSTATTTTATTTTTIITPPDYSPSGRISSLSKSPTPLPTPLPTSPPTSTLSEMHILMQRLNQVEQAVTHSPGRATDSSATKDHKHHNAPILLGVAAQEKRKQALAELRRLAARDQLARNVNELKSFKTHVTASTTTGSK
jgi:hypothetical protein